MREDHRPYWYKKAYLMFRHWYTQHFLAPRCDHLGLHATFMKPWYTQISGPNIHIGDCATIISEPEAPVKIGVWGLEPDTGTIQIGRAVLISPGCRISAQNHIHIGDSVMMANGVYITDSDWHGLYNRIERPKAATPVIIKDNVWLGDHCIILKGVTIGENSVVGAGAVVSKDIPPNVVVAGNPAKIVKQLDAETDFTTRNDFYQNPIAQAQFYDDVDKMVLKKNTLRHYLRTRIWPRLGD